MPPLRHAKQSCNLTNADPRPFVLPPEDGGARWLRARWRDREGYARRHHRQPFPWLTLYEFVGDTAEDAVVLSGEVLGLGRVLRRRRAQALARRRGPIFRAFVGDREGVARRIESTPVCFAWWDFLGTDGVAQVLPDTKVEVFFCWGDAWNTRLAEKAKKLRHHRARRPGSGPSVNPDQPDEKP